jgi:hypothetical protein
MVLGPLEDTKADGVGVSGIKNIATESAPAWSPLTMCHKPRHS